MPTTTPRLAPDQIAEFNRRDRCADLERQITNMAGHINAINYSFVKLLGEFDADDGWKGDGAKSFSHWLNYKCGLSDLTAREKVRVARALRELPQIDAAFSCGEISYSKVRAMTRVATPENEELLLQVARYGTASHVENLVRKYRRCLKHDEQRQNGTRQASSLTCREEDDGSWFFMLRLPAEEGALLMRAVEKMMDDAKRQAEKESAAQNASDLREESAAQEASDPQAKPETLEASPAPHEQDESARDTDVPAETFLGTDHRDQWAANRADAIARMAEHYLATGKNGASVLPGGEKYQVLIHVNANDHHPDTGINGGQHAYSDHFRFIAPETAAQLACDAARTTLLEDDAGNVFNIGRRSRLIPRTMALALKLRDKGCRFPGCHHEKWTDAHHIKHWAQGGETRLDNLVTLCRHHHRALHKGEYRIAACAGTIVFINPNNETIHRSLTPQFKQDSSAEQVVRVITDNHRKRGPTINDNTAISKWRGESMDYYAAVDGLLRRDNR